jgi:hypothetical protein
VRFEVGPFYERPGGAPGGKDLYDWTASYRRAAFFEWGPIDLRYPAAALMLAAGFALGRRRDR